MSLLRILKIAETLYENDKNEYYRVLPLLDGHIKKRAHFSPMAGPGDYDFSGEAENLPWSGNMSEFMRKFPGGLPQWKAMREKLKSKSFVIKDDVMVAKNELLPLNSPAIKRPKVAHYEPKNDKTTPNPWRRNMDYAEWENSPYYGSMSEFMKKFPGGIEDWRKWREKTKSGRYTKWDDGPTKKKNRKARRDMVLGLMKVADEELMSPPDDPVYISLQEESGMDPRAFDERVLSEIDNDLKTKENWIRNAVVVYGISTGRSNAFSFLNDPEISRDNYRENAMDTVFEELRSLNLLRFREIGVEAALGGFEEVEESDEFKKERQALKEDSEESAADDRDDRWLAEKIADDYIADLYWDEEYDREALIKALMRGMRDRREEGSTTPEKEYPMDVEPKPGRWEERPREMSGVIEAHYEPKTVEFVKLTGPKEWMKSVKEFFKKRKDEGQSAEDAAYDAAKEFVDYWKLLLKAKNKRASIKRAQDWRDQVPREWRVKYDWDFRKIRDIEPGIVEWFNQYVMEKGAPMPGDETLGELFDLDELDLTQEEAEHTVNELKKLHIPATTYRVNTAAKKQIKTAIEFEDKTQEGQPEKETRWDKIWKKYDDSVKHMREDKPKFVMPYNIPDVPDIWKELISPPKEKLLEEDNIKPNNKGPFFLLNIEDNIMARYETKEEAIQNAQNSKWAFRIVYSEDEDPIMAMMTDNDAIIYTKGFDYLKKVQPKSGLFWLFDYWGRRIGSYDDFEEAKKNAEANHYIKYIEQNLPNKEPEKVWEKPTTQEQMFGVKASLKRIRDRRALVNGMKI